MSNPNKKIKKNHDVPERTETGSDQRSLYL